MNTIALTLVSVGLLGLLLALYPALQICNQPNYQRNGWRILFGMILLFIIGYLGFIWMLFDEDPNNLEMIVAVIFFAGGGFVLTIIKMSKSTIGELLLTLKEKHHQAHHDALTGLPNRIQFYETLERLTIDTNIPTCCMMMDVNNFKVINDTYGHAFGDYVLQEIAKKIFDAVPSGNLVARIGGDEFTVILPNCNADSAVKVAQAIQQNFLNEIVCDPIQLVVGISIGIAQYPIHGENRKVILKYADIAMYEAKKRTDHIQVFQDNADRHKVNY
ncbi:GGDEF domain-containing protein [Shewanella gelidimarina]|uniref:GGDEF domain-containing protein n=1 Tax=Shewanella gelidimarina TaxID=56813 RepID=UPI00200C986F|nr:GGDEF domain-containing protein [Shewanella gelidimarina]MCL1058471.1 GGDEF domain-containing protein [Shewanella gelidimarina]